jgi:WD40 repeat protein
MYCLNPYCRNPQNPDSTKFCSSCGTKLLLGDRYRAMQPIGRGGFGRTFLAVDEHKPSRPKCVIKQFLPQIESVSNPEQARDLFRREAVQLEQLGTHPQIPELLAHFEQAEQQYLVQEFIDGQNLNQELAQTGMFDDGKIWQLLNSLLPVLDYIHQHQVIHRDIKPQNIIRRSTDQQYVLVDFGAAKAIDGVEFARTGTSIGSPEFTPPEQTIGKATYASDLYSLGVTCIYLMTQVRPADLYDTGEGSWAWRSHIDRPINTVLGDILDKLLQGPIKRRYQSAMEVLRDLHTPEILQALEKREESGGAERRFANRSQESAQAKVAPGSKSTTQNSQLFTVLPTTTLPAEAKAPSWVCSQTLTGHGNWVRSLVIHPNGRTLASGSGDRTIKFWDWQTGKLLRDLQAHESWVRAIALSPDGKLLASCSNDRTVKLWNWETGNLLHTLTGHTDWVRSVAFAASITPTAQSTETSQNGQILASSSQDRTIRLWHIATGELLQILSGHLHWVTAVAFIPCTLPGNQDGHLLVSGSRDRTLRLWDWHTGKLVASLEGHSSSVNGIAVSPDGSILASGDDDGSIRLWDLQTGKSKRVISGHAGAVNSVAIAADGSTLISGSHDKTIKLWNLTTGNLLGSLSGHAGWIWSVAVRPTGNIPKSGSSSGAFTGIASGSWDGTIKLWQKGF